MKKNIRGLAVSITFGLVFTLASLGGAAPGPLPTKNGSFAKTAVRLGMLPIIDNLPFWIAAEKGYFREEGIAAELIFFPSAVERDSAFTARRIDAGIGDLIALAALNDAGIELRGASTAMGNSKGESRFAVLSAPDSDIRKAEQLKGVPVAISLNSIIEYATDRLLAHQGLKKAEIKKISIPKMPVRLESLLQGTVRAATLPDPFVTLALLKGAHIIADTMNDNVAKTVVIVQKDFAEGNLPVVRKLVRVYGRAVDDIKEDPSGFNNILAKQARVPNEVLGARGRRLLPVNFSKPRQPAGKDVQDVLDWMKERGLLKRPHSYEELILEGICD